MPSEAADTLAASGDTPVAATLAVTEATDTLQGALVRGEESDSLAASGDTPVSGRYAVTESDDRILLVFDADSDSAYFPQFFISNDADSAYYAGGGQIDNDQDSFYSTDGTVENELDSFYRSPGITIDQDTTARYGVLPMLVELPADPGLPWTEVSVGGGPPTTPPMLSGYDLAWKYNEGTLQQKFNVSGTRQDANGGTISIGSIDFDSIPDQWLSSWAESAQTTWAITITDKNGYYHPDTTVEGSPWNDVMNPDCIGGKEMTQTINHGTVLPPVVRMTYDNVASKLISVTSLWNENESNFQGVGTAFTSRKNKSSPAGGYILNWKGTDLSQLLFATGQTMKTVRSSRKTGVFFSQSVMAEICSTYNVLLDLSYLPDNFPVALMHRQNGRPIDWLQALLKVSFAEWTMVNGNVFTPYLPAYGIPSGFTYDLSDNHVDEEVMERSLHPIVNEVTAVQAVESGGGVIPPFECTEFKEYTITMPYPVSGLHWAPVSQQGGFFTDFYCYAGSTLVGIRQQREPYIDPVTGILSGGSPTVFDPQLSISGQLNGITSVKVTWGNVPGGSDLITGGYGKIQFMGSLGQDDTTFGGQPISTTQKPNSYDPTPGLRGAARNLSSVFIYGRRKYELPANPLLPTRAWCYIHASRYLQRVARQYDGANYRVPYNNSLYPGMSVGFVDAWGNKFNRILTKVEQSASNSISKRYTSFTGFSYQPFTLVILGPQLQVIGTYPNWNGDKISTYL